LDQTQFEIMEPEREIARVRGLGRGSLPGFSLIVTDRKIVGIDTRRFTLRIWLSMMLGLGLGLILVALVLFSGLEPVLFRINPLLDFVTMLLLVFSLPIITTVLVPRYLRKRLGQTGGSVVQALKKDIISIDVRRPSRISEKGYFTVSLVSGTSFTFWTVGQDTFDYVNSLLTNFAPGQISDSSISIGQFDLVRRLNKLLVGITAFVILLIIIGGWVLLPYITLVQLIYFIIGVITVHVIIITGYLLLRRLRRYEKRVP